MVRELTEKEIDRLLQKELNERYHKARNVLISEDRVKAFAKSLVIAIREAKKNKNCEVKVTCKNDDEVILAIVLLETHLEKHKFIDLDACEFGVLELVNGSCIKVVAEPDFSSGADALMIGEPDGSGSVRA